MFMILIMALIDMLGVASIMPFSLNPVEIETLKMGSDGIVTATNNKPVSPYIVVNIKKGITLAPSQIEKNLATEVLEAYHRTTNYPLTTSNTVIPYFNAVNGVLPVESFRPIVSTSTTWGMQLGLRYSF